jgi:nucleotidyltransferase/DNA polymerase involved in DNA repair
VLKLKLARPLGQGRYPILTRSVTLEHPSDDGLAITNSAIDLLARVSARDRIRLVGVQVHNLDRTNTGPLETQLGLFDGSAANEARRARLNRAVDAVTARYGEEAITRGLARAERAAPTRRIK